MNGLKGINKAIDANGLDKVPKDSYTAEQVAASRGISVSHASRILAIAFKAGRLGRVKVSKFLYYFVKGAEEAAE